jgi:hypothetical protein
VSDPVKRLQCAARECANHVCPGVEIARVVVISAAGSKIMDFAVPATACDPREGEKPPPVFAPGWSFVGRIALFDGRAVPVSPSRVRLLRTLAEAAEPTTAKDLTERAFDAQTDVANTRFHLRELEKELKAHFDDFEGKVIRGDNDGYQLLLR